MAAVTVESHSREELVERARSLAPLLERNAPEADRRRRLPDETVDAIEKAGLFSLLTTQRLGGIESDVRTAVEVIAALGESCGSTAWVTAIVNGSNFMLGLFGERAQEEVLEQGAPFKTASVFNPSAASEPAPGGLVVTGKWAWASGCLHADWALGAVPVLDESGSPVDQAFALMPMRELGVEDTWLTAGMRGTGSNTMVADHVFVPDHRLLSVPRALQGGYPEEGPPTGLARSTIVPLLVTLLSAPLVGLARGATRIAAEKAPRRGISYTAYETQPESSVFAAQLGEAEMIVRDAELQALAAAEAIDAAAAEGEQLDLPERAQIRGGIGHVTRRVREAFDLLLTAHGASSFAEASPLQQMWRDASTGARHAVLTAPVNYEVHGRAMLGVDNITPLL